MEYTRKILDEKIEDAEKVLIGIGMDLLHTGPEFYRDLFNIISKKDYYIVSLCSDDNIYYSELDENRIVTPCGGHRKLQCEKNCNNKIYDLPENYEEGKVLCPDCSAKLVYNEISTENYCENGYLDHWKNYTNWLQNTINKKLCILEMGVEMEFPSVIRWPFEKVAIYNQKSIFFRINCKFSQLPEGIDQRGYQAKIDPKRIFAL